MMMLDLKCSICKGTAIKHLDINAFGSEGVYICQQCLIDVGEFIMELTLQKQRERKAEAVAKKLRRLKDF